MIELKKWIIDYYGEEVWNSYFEKLSKNNNPEVFFHKEAVENYISKAFLWWETKEECSFWLWMSINWRNR